MFIVDWSKLTPEEIALALRTIPKLVAYAWKQDSDGNWLREDCEEYGCARGAMVIKNADSLTWIRGKTWSTFTGVQSYFDTAEEAMQATDAYLKANGWILIDSDDGSKDCVSDWSSQRSISQSEKESC